MRIYPYLLVGSGQRHCRVPPKHYIWVNPNPSSCSSPSLSLFLLLTFDREREFVLSLLQILEALSFCHSSSYLVFQDSLFSDLIASAISQFSFSLNQLVFFCCAKEPCRSFDSPFSRVSFALMSVFFQNGTSSSILGCHPCFLTRCRIFCSSKILFRHWIWHFALPWFRAPPPLFFLRFVAQFNPFLNWSNCHCCWGYEVSIQKL